MRAMTDIYFNSEDHAFDLAEALDKTLEQNDEITLSVTDARLVVHALRHFVRWLDSQD